MLLPQPLCMSDKIKILSLVSYPFLPPRMGGQKGIALFNQYLGQKLDLHCVCTKNNDPRFASTYRVSNIISNAKTRYINPAYFFRIRRIIRSEKITHLILEHPYYGWLAILLKWFCGIKLVAHSHNIESSRFKSMGKWWWGIMWHYEKFIHGRADLNFFIQEDDRLFAIRYYKLKPEKCHAITYGIEMDKAPSADERKAARQTICSAWHIDPADKLLLFNGTLDYRPNRDALDAILEKINPLLMNSPAFRYKILICGNKLPAVYNDLRDQKDNNIIYAGFVDDITIYFKGADVFINPVTDGGGIKTKVVEALGFNLSVVSTQSGAIGIPVEITGNKMLVLEDEDNKGFADAVLQTDDQSQIPGSFFTHFYWGHIAAKAADAISG